jgi:serine phosphatase RsbU (regulator of sigma subunit)
VSAGTAQDDLPFPIVVTRGPQHVVSWANPAARGALPGLAVGRPLRDARSQPPLLPALDRVVERGEATVVELAEPAMTVGLVPMAGGAVLHGIPGVAGVTGARERGVALQRLAGELLGAATPTEIGRLVVTTAAALLGAGAAVAYARTDADTLDVIHASGWPEETTRPFARLTLRRGRPLSDAALRGEPVWLEDAAQWRARYPEMAPIGTSSGIQATACLPLRVEDRDLGAVVFSFAGTRAFPPDERDYLQAVAALCAQALDRARLLVAERAARAVAEQQLARMTFLAHAGRLMEAPLSVEERLQQLADLVVPEIADWCSVHLVRDERVEQITVAHEDPDKIAFVTRLQERYPPDPDAPGGAISVSRSGEPAFFPDLPDEMMVAAAVDEEHLALIRSIGMRSAMVVPLLVRGRSLGALTLVHAESGRRFDEADLAFAGQVATTAAIALDNARLYQLQHSIADTLQAALLPAALPVAPGLCLAARYRAQTVGGVEHSVSRGADVHVGGDLYDVVPGVVPGRWSVVVADVCGKGPEAAALTAMIRHTLRSEVAHGLAPVEALRRLNEAMLLDTAAGTSRFATVAHAQVDVDATGATVRLAGAGHPPALIRRGDRVEAVALFGTLLGVYPDVDLVATTLRLDPGDMMVLYTDGVTEARGVDGFYGADRLARVVGSPAPGGAEALAERLLADVVAFQSGRLRDDVALLVVEVAP